MSTSASERGLVFCLYEPKDPTSSTNTTTPPEVYDAKVKTITHLSSTDDKVSEGFPRINTMYEVENIRPLLSPAAYQEDVAANKATTRIKDYHVFKRIDGRERPDLGTAPCPKGTTMVCVGITPKPETYEGCSHPFRSTPTCDLKSCPPIVRDRTYMWQIADDM